MINQTQLKNIDWILIALLLINTLIGIAVIYSSSHHLPGNYYLRQVFWTLLSLLALFVLLAVDYNILVTYSLYFYIACMSILGAILIFGRLIAGTKSWIKLEFIQIQPSEITKIAIILVLARIFSEFKKGYLTNEAAISSTAFVLLAIVLVALQPDLGTALSYIPILLAAFILAGLTRKTLVMLLIIAIVMGVVSWG
ncbi:MAG: FtsW/RodA/SpoVE family cell cycle protein, partial [Candidatus Aminicenantes bacterium]